MQSCSRWSWPRCRMQSPSMITENVAGESELQSFSLSKHFRVEGIDQTSAAEVSLGWTARFKGQTHFRSYCHIYSNWLCFPQWCPQSPLIRPGVSLRVRLSQLVFYFYRSGITIEFKTRRSTLYSVLLICSNIYFKCQCVSTVLFTLCKLCIYYVVLFRSGSSGLFDLVLSIEIYFAITMIISM